MTKLDSTTLTSIALSVLAVNIFKTDIGNFFVLYLRKASDERVEQYYIEFEAVA